MPSSLHCTACEAQGQAGCSSALHLLLLLLVFCFLSPLWPAQVKAGPGDRKVLSVGKWTEERDFGSDTREGVEDESTSVSQVEGVLKSQ